MKNELFIRENIANVNNLFTDNDIEIKFLIKDFCSDNYILNNFPTIDFFEFRWLINHGELDGVIIFKNFIYYRFIDQIVRLCKLYNIPNVGIVNTRIPNKSYSLYWLAPQKAHLFHLESNIVDGCNLNCKGCSHFASLFRKDEVYPVDAFQRDMERISQICDLSEFCPLGGEPLLLPNFDEYIRISRRCFPETDIIVYTNGLLIPSLPQKILDSIKENNIRISISKYPPTEKILDKICAILDANKIPHDIAVHLTGPLTDKFRVFLTLHGGNNPNKARATCSGADGCYFLRDGKIYKCPFEGLRYRLEEHFGIENLPAPTFVDIYNPNFPMLITMLADNVEMCFWCTEQSRSIDWEVSNNPKLEDWLADPNEIKNF